jgi:hypothetical protein
MQFIFNLSGKINAFAVIICLKNEADFTWWGGGEEGGVGEQQHAFNDIKKILIYAIGDEST